MRQCPTCGTLFENFDCPTCAARRLAEIEMEEWELEMRREREQREMDDHFRRYPHG